MSNSLFYIYKYSRSNSVDGNIGVLRIEIFDVDCFKFPGNCKNLLCRYTGTVCESKLSFFEQILLAVCVKRNRIWYTEFVLFSSSSTTWYFNILCVKSALETYIWDIPGTKLTLGCILPSWENANQISKFCSGEI